MKKLLISIINSLLIISCSQEQIEVWKKKRTLKKEFNEIYQDNERKNQAAKFLIKELNNKFTIKGEQYEVYVKNIIELKDRVDSLESKLGKVKGTFNQNIVAEDDLSNIDIDYLTANIDQAFVAFEKSTWRNNVSFEDFCNYVLPHRLKHEPLEDWRKKVLNDYGDSTFKFQSIDSASLYLAHKITENKKDIQIRFGASNPNIPDIPYSILKILPVGSCKEMTDYTSFVFRSFAIPCANDFTPNYSNISSGHNWNAVIKSADKIIPFVLPLDAEVDTLGRFKADHYKLAKVYRHIYEKNSRSHIIKKGFCKYLPDFYNNPYIKDVTSEYISVIDVVVDGNEQLDLINEKEDFAYLSVFDGKSWVPIAWGEKEKRTYNFSDVGKGSLYLPQLIGEGFKENLNYPFSISEEGEIRYHEPNKSDLITLKLLRKYPLTQKIKGYINRMTGGEFQVSNSLDFSDAETIYKVNEFAGEYYNNINVNTNKKYRYIRYLSPSNSYCNVAELEFYETNDTLNALSGEIIATKGKNKMFPERTKEKSFDGDVLTFFHSIRPDSCWIGMDFGKPVNIGLIRFIARTDYNIIVPGNLYEVFYWNNQWISLCTKKADSHVLTYDDVPSNALYFIKNHTAGKEERIFTYENGEQVWW